MLLGTLSANCLNLYSGALSALVAWDARRRPAFAAAAGIAFALLATVLLLAARANDPTARYAPWIVVAAALRGRRACRRRRSLDPRALAARRSPSACWAARSRSRAAIRRAPRTSTRTFLSLLSTWAAPWAAVLLATRGAAAARATNAAALFAWLAGIAASLPFWQQSWYTGAGRRRASAARRRVVLRVVRGRVRDRRRRSEHSARAKAPPDTMPPGPLQPLTCQHEPGGERVRVAFAADDAYHDPHRGRRGPRVRHGARRRARASARLAPPRRRCKPPSSTLRRAGHRRTCPHRLPHHRTCAASCSPPRTGRPPKFRWAPSPSITMPTRTRIQIVISGSGTEWLGDKQVALKPGTMLIIPAGTPHAGTTEPNLKIVAIEDPAAGGNGRSPGTVTSAPIRSVGAAGIGQHRNEYWTWALDPFRICRRVTLRRSPCAAAFRRGALSHWRDQCFTLSSEGAMRERRWSGLRPQSVLGRGGGRAFHPRLHRRRDPIRSGLAR